jgi:hypothetical protein
VPRLTHAQTIPGPRRQRPVHPASRRDFRWDVEPAPEHRFTGYSILAPARFTPERVSRGFVVPDQDKEEEVRRKHDKRGVMDREGDVWARWYEMEEEERSK